MKKPFQKIIKQAMQERITEGVRRRLNASAPTTLSEPDLSFKEDEDSHFWRGK